MRVVVGWVALLAVMVCIPAAASDGRARLTVLSHNVLYPQVVLSATRGGDGKTHEFQASPEMVRDFKVGDRIEANLRDATNR